MRRSKRKGQASKRSSAASRTTSTSRARSRKSQRFEEPGAAARLEIPGGCPIVGVGASAGGLEAFSQLLGGLPAAPGLSIVLISHLAPQHASALPALLSGTTAMPVVQAAEEWTDYDPQLRWQPMP